MDYPTFQTHSSPIHTSHSNQFNFNLPSATANADFQFPRRSNSLSSISYNDASYYSTSVRRITWTTKQDYQLIESILLSVYKLVEIKTMKIFWDLVRVFLFNNYKLIRNIRQVRDRFSLLFHRYLSKHSNLNSHNNNGHTRTFSKSSDSESDSTDPTSSSYQENTNLYLQFLSNIFKFDQGLKIKEKLGDLLPRLKTEYDELIKMVSLDLDVIHNNSNGTRNYGLPNIAPNINNLSNHNTTFNENLKRQRSINFDIKEPPILSSNIYPSSSNINTLSNTGFNSNNLDYGLSAGFNYNTTGYKKLKKKRSQSFDDVKERQKFLLNNEFNYNFNSNFSSFQNNLSNIGHYSTGNLPLSSNSNINGLYNNFQYQYNNLSNLSYLSYDDSNIGIPEEDLSQALDHTHSTSVGGLDNIGNNDDDGEEESDQDVTITNIGTSTAAISTESGDDDDDEDTKLYSFQRKFKKMEKNLMAGLNNKISKLLVSFESQLNFISSSTVLNTPSELNISGATLQKITNNELITDQEEENSTYNNNNNNNNILPNNNFLNMSSPNSNNDLLKNSTERINQTQYINMQNSNNGSSAGQDDLNNKPNRCKDGVKLGGANKLNLDLDLNFDSSGQNQSLAHSQSGIPESGRNNNNNGNKRNSYYY